MKFYLAAPLFNAEEQYNITVAVNHLRNLEYEVYSPMEHTVENAWEMPNHEWAKAVFDEDVRALDECDAVLAIYDGLYSDSGTAWELGYAYAKGKEIYVLVAAHAKQVSLMVANGCYTVINGTDFLSYDFEKKEKKICAADQK